ncbi:hypothetical protein [Pseudomonas phage PA1C]|uniref:Uncharacterized protein n=1 Tax=Pseudomonas phage vB_PaeM_PS119XW TaxID=2601632 RepID=A0A5C1K9Q8_9CAUD|nr:hypothetical protein PP933_gp295 [Pseudomonas phage vB_PaeM_PS119XW]QBX32452.1 hypothetical protein [Pseudomonas phage PA1C]QEM42024.1 hypothetical protein [Pseudomonas phage vB_PaeM_PS119XW]BEG72539.1 hypothetical protein RVBP21_1670 [Pseudomonas phage BRkr]
MDTDKRYQELWKKTIVMVVTDTVMSHPSCLDKEHVHFCDGTQVIIGDTSFDPEVKTWTIAVGTGPGILHFDVTVHDGGVIINDYASRGCIESAELYRDCAQVLVKWAEYVTR